MDSKIYVLNHDYGYGKEYELKELNKLNLRNFNDLQVYLEDLITKEVADFDNVVTFKTNEVEINLEKFKIKQQKRRQI